MSFTKKNPQPFRGLNLIDPRDLPRREWSHGRDTYYQAYLLMMLLLLQRKINNSHARRTSRGGGILTAVLKTNVVVWPSYLKSHEQFLAGRPPRTHYVVIALTRHKRCTRLLRDSSAVSALRSSSLQRFHVKGKSSKAQTALFKHISQHHFLVGFQRRSTLRFNEGQSVQS